MARTLSQDLRDRVVAAIDGGLSCRAAAARLGVSVSSAIRWRQRAMEHGQAVANDVTPGFPPAGIRAGPRCALLPNLGPLGSGVFRLSQIRRAGFTG